MRLSTRFVPLLLAWSCLLPAGHILAAAPEEDLSACTLPHGKVMLPLVETLQGDKGYLFKFSDSTFGKLPLEPGKTPPQLAEKIRADKSADLQYLSDGGGTLWAISGRISDLGRITLAGAAAMKYDAPLEIPGSTRLPTGLLPGVAEGHTYLVQTVDNHFALVRVLEQTADGATVQFVYQPASSMTFNITGGAAPASTPAATVASTATRPATGAAVAAATMPAPPDLPPRPVTTLPRAGRPQLGPGEYASNGYIILRGGRATAPAAAAPSAVPSPAVAASPTGIVDPAVTALDQQRAQLIQQSLEALAAAARTPAEIDRKVRAINDLGVLRADEAADPLVAQITFLNTQSTRQEFSQDALHPCLAALKRLGKSASNAALKALRQLDLDAPGEGMDSPMYRAGLLGMVIRGVEGSDVGDFILRQEMERQTDPKRRAVFEYLLESAKN